MGVNYLYYYIDLMPDQQPNKKLHLWFISQRTIYLIGIFIFLLSQAFDDMNMAVFVWLVKIDSMIWSFYLCHNVPNGLSYPGKETPTLCINDAKLRSGVKDLVWNKHQLLHRITSVKTPLIYNMNTIQF